MAGNIYKETYRVRYYDCEITGRMTLPSLINVVIDVSGAHSDRIIEDVGIDYLADNNLSWIIIQYVIDVNRMPLNGEKITIETEAIGYTRIFTYRHFRVYDEAGKLLVTIETTFAVMDLGKRKLTRITDQVIQGYEAQKRKRLERYPAPRKLDEATTLEIYKKDYYVRYFDIDGNEHVNNSLYFTWSLDLLGAEFLSTHELSYANIKFEKEVYYGDTVISKATIQEEDNQVVTAHVIETNGIKNSEIQYNWRKI